MATTRVLARRNDSVKIRTAAGEIGWIDGRQLLEPALWSRSTKLLQQAQAIPVQAHGRTKVQTNLRVQPGRTEPRLYQFGRGVPVEIVGRGVADWTQVTDDKEPVNDSGDKDKKEDWYLVRAVATRPPGESAARTAETNTTTQPGDQSIPIAGWVVARFVELDLPDPAREGLASANVRAVAWFELNRVTDLPAKSRYRLLERAAQIFFLMIRRPPRSTPGTEGNPDTKPRSSRIICAANCPCASATARTANRSFAFTPWTIASKSAFTG
jgi:hypothetical protein